MKRQNPQCACSMCKWVRAYEAKRPDLVPIPLPKEGFWPPEHIR